VGLHNKEQSHCLCRLPLFTVLASAACIPACDSTRFEACFSTNMLLLLPLLLLLLLLLLQVGVLLHKAEHHLRTHMVHSHTAYDHTTGQEGGGAKGLNPAQHHQGGLNPTHHHWRGLNRTHNYTPPPTHALGDGARSKQPETHTS